MRGERRSATPAAAPGVRQTGERSGWRVTRAGIGCRWRPAEALTASTVACHHTLTELLLFLGRKANESDEMRKKAGVLLSTKDLEDICRLNENFIENTVPETIGATLSGEERATPVSQALRKQGRQWALHVLEGPHSWCLSAIYILVTVTFSSPPFLMIKNAIWGDGSNELDDSIEKGQNTSDRLKYAALVLDSVVYMFLPLLFSLILRIVQGRSLMARCVDHA